MSVRAQSFAMIALLSVLCWNTGQATEQTSPIVIARAVGDYPRQTVVDFVATHAEATRFDVATRPDMRNLTARELITSMCGSVQEGYLQAIKKLNPNAKDVALDSPLNDAAFTTDWPACLFAQSGTDDTLIFQLRRNETLTHIRQAAVGDGKYDRIAINKFFEDSGYQVANARRLPAGLKLKVPYVTAATTLSPRGDLHEFLQGLARVGGQNVAASPVSESPGTIVGPVEDVAGDVQGIIKPCSAGDGSRPYPFDATEIASAFRFTSQYSELPDRLTIVVADNGFFGVPCPDQNDCPKFEGSRIATSERFPRELFNYEAYRSENGLGPAHRPSGISTLNYWNRHPDGRLYNSGDVDQKTGHGTHVAGLMLGGPEFLPYRDTFISDNGKSRWSLVILNLSGGSPRLALGSDQTFSTLMQQVDGDRKIVNLSVAFHAAVDANIPAVIRRAVSRDETTLFVVAAGNDGGILHNASLETYPARLGGGAFGSEPNVITVASIDGPINGTQSLSSFTNRSERYVDIAAPGCQMRSWVNNEQPIVAVSGTSQAAPIVSFSAALLQTLWQAPAQRLKNRLLYSGDILDRAEDRDVIFSRSKVNTAKSLTFLWDRLTFVQNGTLRTLLGSVNVLTGFRCQGDSKSLPLTTVRSLKRDGELFTAYKVNHAGLLELCPGKFDSDARVTFTAEKEIVGGNIADTSEPSFLLEASDIVDIVMDH